MNKYQNCQINSLFKYAILLNFFFISQTEQTTQPQCRNGSVQFWVALFVKANKQIEDVALRTVEDFYEIN